MTCWWDINLLREGLDMPEVSLVAILDADKEGFLRSERSLAIQTIGRAARNLHGKAILYADRIHRVHEKAPVAAQVASAAAPADRPHTREKGIDARDRQAGEDLIDGVYSEKAGRDAQRLENEALQCARVQELSEKDLAKRSNAWKRNAGARPT